MDNERDASICHWVRIEYSDFHKLSESRELHLAVDILHDVPQKVKIDNPYVKFTIDSDIPVLCDEYKNDKLIFISRLEWENVLNNIVNYDHKPLG